MRPSHRLLLVPAAKRQNKRPVGPQQSPADFSASFGAVYRRKARVRPPMNCDDALGGEVKCLDHTLAGILAGRNDFRGGLDALADALGPAARLIATEFGHQWDQVV